MHRFLSTVSLIAAMASPALSFDMTAMTDEERAAFGEEIRNYILENPELLVEAIGVLEQRNAQEAVQQDQQLVADNADAIFNDGYSFVGGNPDGDITIVEFVDYRCGYCRKSEPELTELIEGDGNIRLVVKEFPILGENSVKSSQFAVAIKQLHGDEAYKAVHDVLIGLNADMTEDTITALAEDLGYDPEEILAKMESDEVIEELRKTNELAKTLNITGTPTFVMGDQMIRGYVPLGAMQQRVEAIRAETAQDG